MIGAFVFAALLCLTVLCCLEEIRTLKNENDRLSQNLSAKNESFTELKTMNGLASYQSQVLELRLNELTSLYPKLMDEIRNLKVKPSRTESISATSYNSEKHITTTLRDSLILDTIPVKVFSYSDSWYHVHGVAEKDNQQVTIQMQDTLVQVVFRGERVNPWLWIFSPRKLQQRVSLKNPNAKIVYTQFIELQKGRGKKP